MCAHSTNDIKQTLTSWSLQECLLAIDVATPRSHEVRSISKKNRLQNDEGVIRNSLVLRPSPKALPHGHPKELSEMRDLLRPLPGLWDCGPHQRAPTETAETTQVDVLMLLHRGLDTLKHFLHTWCDFGTGRDGFRAKIKGHQASVTMLLRLVSKSARASHLSSDSLAASATPRAAATLVRFDFCLTFWFFLDNSGCFAAGYFSRESGCFQPVERSEHVGADPDEGLK